MTRQCKTGLEKCFGPKERIPYPPDNRVFRIIDTSGDSVYNRREKINGGR